MTTQNSTRTVSDMTLNVLYSIGDHSGKGEGCVTQQGFIQATFCSICLSVSVCLSVFGSVALCWTLAAFSVFLSIHSRYNSLDGGSARRKAATNTQNKRTHTTIPWMGFEPTIPAFERAKTVRALDRALTVIGHVLFRGQ
jgi:hypothetical protein